MVKLPVAALDHRKFWDAMDQLSPEMLQDIHKVIVSTMVEGYGIETEGLVGDKFLSIHKGDPRLPIAPAKSTLRSKPPFEVSKLFEQASDLVGQVDRTMTEVRGELGGALEALTATVNNTNGLVTAIHQGQGAAGVLLSDKETAANVKQIVLNGRQATANLVTPTAAPAFGLGGVLQLLTPPASLGVTLTGGASVRREAGMPRSGGGRLERRNSVSAGSIRLRKASTSTGRISPAVSAPGRWATVRTLASRIRNKSASSPAVRGKAIAVEMPLKAQTQPHALQRQLAGTRRSA